MPVNGVSGVGSGAQSAQLAYKTGPLGGDVFPGQALGMQALGFIIWLAGQR